MNEFGPEICSDLERGTRLEYVVGNGLGNFVSGTLTGLRTRPEHGLLALPDAPHSPRRLLLGALDLEARADDPARGSSEWLLSVHRVAGLLHPEGHRYLAGFRLDPFPTHVYAFGGHRLEVCALPLADSISTLVVLTHVSGPGPLSLQAFPLTTDRPLAHAEESDRTWAGRALLLGTVGVKVIPRSPERSLTLLAEGGSFDAEPRWRKQHQLLSIRDGAPPPAEDFFCPGQFRFELEPGRSGHLFVSAELGKLPGALPDLFAKERKTALERAHGMARLRASIPSLTNPEGVFVSRHRPKPGFSLVSAYPALSESPRDMMIALPGLFLATGRFDEAKLLLEGTAQHLAAGLLPARLPVEAHESVGTIDGALWLVYALGRYLDYTGDLALGAALAQSVFSVIENLERGTHHGIQVDFRDDLLAGGDGHVPLTWMDRQVGSWVVTPRPGKPVEANALYHNALHVAARIAEPVDPHRAKGYLDAAERLRASFRRIGETSAGPLWDRVEPDGTPCREIRPNALLAFLLPHTPIARGAARAMVDVARERLLTERGLRTLARESEGYRSHVGTEPAVAAAAWHQGSVHPWLLGAYASALLRSEKRSDTALMKVRAIVEGVGRAVGASGSHLAGVGQIPELFDADPPHRPAGGIASLLAVAELNRIVHEELEGRHTLPPLEES